MNFPRPGSGNKYPRNKKFKIKYPRNKKSKHTKKFDFFPNFVYTIIDKNTNQVINKQKNPLIIGNHCWLGENVKILKNAQISNNTIIGIESVVAGKYDEEFTILAGNPAKIVKYNVDFNRKRIYKYC